MKNKFLFIYFTASLFLMSCNTSKTFYGKTYDNLEERKKVHRLDLSNYKEDIKLDGFDDLRMLNISNLKDAKTLEQVVNSISNPEKLEILYLDNNHLKVLPKFLTKFTGLKQLSLNNNPQLNLAASFKNISTLPLEFLNLQFNQLNSIPKEIQCFQALEDLNLSHNQVLNFNHLSELPKLRSLWLRNNKISVLGPSVNKISQLVNLYLENNHLTTLPGHLTGLTSLRVLHLSFNKFTELPEPLQTLPGVMLLHIDHCNINTIANTFTPKTVSFKGLVMNDNKLSSQDIEKWKTVFGSFFLLIF